MGRGQGQGSRVETSGTQGRVYAVIPQIEPVDQLTLQGMFLFSRLWARVLFDCVAYACDCVCSCV